MSEHEPATLHFADRLYGTGSNAYWSSCPCGWESGRKFALGGSEDFAIRAQELALRDHGVHAYQSVKRSHAVLDSVAQDLADALRYCLKHLSPMLTGLSPDGPREGVLDALVALERFDNLNKKAGTE
jgi:hypothetical protein